MSQKFEGELTRRQFLRESGRLTGYAFAATVVGVGAKVGYENRYAIADASGRLLDTINPPERIISHAVPVLLPRAEAVWNVEPKAERSEKVHINPIYTVIDDKVVLNLINEFPLNVDYSGAELSEHTFVEAGYAVITSPKGVDAINQDFCALFEGKNDKAQLVAVGFNDSFYTYDPISNEWGPVITEDDKQVYTASWDTLQEKKPDRMLISEIAAGIETLSAIGYHPWPAILASTRMPDSSVQQTPLEDYAQGGDEVREGNKRYYVTENGDLVDRFHLGDHARETLSVFSQLHIQSLTQEKSPKVKVKYHPYSDYSYAFDVDPRSLQPDTIWDTTAKVMFTTDYLIEGVSQRYIIEDFPDIVAKFDIGGMQAEDMFSDSLGIITMLSVMKEQGLMSIKDPTVFKAEVDRIKERLVKEVVEKVVQKYGVRSTTESAKKDYSIGIYPLIPFKVTDEDGSKVTTIDLEGIDPNNPNVHIKITDVPAMPINFERGVQRVDALLGNS